MLACTCGTFPQQRTFFLADHYLIPGLFANQFFLRSSPSLPRGLFSSLHLTNDVLNDEGRAQDIQANYSKINAEISTWGGCLCFDSMRQLAEHCRIKYNTGENLMLHFSDVFIKVMMVSFTMYVRIGAQILM